MKEILVTRPLSDAKILAKKFEKQGLKPFIEPMFEIQAQDLAPLKKIINQNKLAALILTSKNAACALKSEFFAQDILIFAVGKETEAAIKAQGYRNIKTASDSADSLIKLIKSTTKTPLLYLSSDIISKNLTDELSGLEVLRFIVYKIKARTQFSPELIAKLQNQEIDMVSFYSRNTVKIFWDLIRQHNLQNHIKHLQYKAFSPEIEEFCKNANLG